MSSETVAVGSETAEHSARPETDWNWKRRSCFLQYWKNRIHACLISGNKEYEGRRFGLELVYANLLVACFYSQIWEICLFVYLFPGTCWGFQPCRQLYSFLVSCFFLKVPDGWYRKARLREHGGFCLRCAATRQSMRSMTASKTTLKKKKKKLEQVCWMLVRISVYQWGAKNQTKWSSCRLWELDCLLFLTIMLLFEIFHILVISEVSRCFYSPTVLNLVLIFLNEEKVKLCRILSRILSLY